MSKFSCENMQLVIDFHKPLLVYDKVVNKQEV